MRATEMKQNKKINKRTLKTITLWRYFQNESQVMEGWWIGVMGFLFITAIAGGEEEVPKCLLLGWWCSSSSLLLTLTFTDLLTTSPVADGRRSWLVWRGRLPSTSIRPCHASQALMAMSSCNVGHNARRSFVFVQVLIDLCHQNENNNNKNNTAIFIISKC